MRPPDVTMTRRLLAVAIVVVAAAGASVAPRTLAAPVVIEGLSFDDRLQLGDSTLVLNGVGLRAVAWLKGYAAGMYLTQRAATPAAALAAPGPKRIRMRMLLDVDSAEFAKAVDKGFRRNTPEAEQARIADRARQFDAAIRAIGPVRRGDVIDLDYLPGRGTALLLNGKPRGPVLPGEDFYGAVMRIFLGERPVDAELKAGLLGRPPR